MNPNFLMPQGMRLCCASLATLMVLFNTSAAATQLQVSPVRLSFQADERVKQLRLGNPGDTPLVLQIELMQWQQIASPAGAQASITDKLTANRDFLATPPIVEVAPHSRKIIRIGPRKPPQQGCESAYRVVVTEIPPQAGPDQRPVKFRSQVSLPLFFHSNADCKPKLQWQRQGTQLSMHNTGSAHAQITALELQRGAQRWPIPYQGLAYLLPGTTRLFELPHTLPAGLLDDPLTNLTISTNHTEQSGALSAQP